MALDISSLTQKHSDHDEFIRSYLNLSEFQTDIVLEQINDSLENLAGNKPNLVGYVLANVDNPENNNPVHRLALYLLLTYYSDSWKMMFPAAFELLKSLLSIIRDSEELIFPPKWSEKVFLVEYLLSPDNLRGVLFGIDPTYSYPEGKFATGLAFSFDVPDSVVIDSKSTSGLMKVYGLSNFNFNRLQSLERNFVVTYGLALVNFIRTIQDYSYAGSGNKFKDAWAKYNWSWLRASFPNGLDGKILIFQNEHYVFDQYSDSSIFTDVRNGLANAPRCSHPSYVEARSDHCLKNPNTFYRSVKGVDISPTRCNSGVLNFVSFLQHLGAKDACRCLCATCSPIEVEELVSNILKIDLDHERTIS